MGHLVGVIACIYFSRARFLTFAHTFIHSPPPPCSGLNNLQLLSPNIWHSPCSKPKNDPNDATQKNKPASLVTRRGSLASSLCSKPTTHPKSLNHHRGSGACNLQRYHLSQVATRNQQQHFHHSSRIKPKCQRRQLNPNQWRCSTSITPVGTLANSSHLRKCRVLASPC
jgi:hypothetical protein